MVEEPTDVNLHHVTIAAKLELLRQGPHRLPRSPSLAVRPAAGQEILLIDGSENASGRSLQQLVLNRRNPQRPSPSPFLRNVTSPDQLRPVAAPLQPLDEPPNVGDEILCVLPGCHPIDAAGGSRIEEPPAGPQSLFVQQPEQIAEAVVPVGSRLVRYIPRREVA